MRQSVKQLKMLNVKQTAFTLVELLVVISIIAVLMGILMPALQAVKKQASASVCMSNTKNMGMGWYMYMGDNDGNIMSATDNNTYSWIRVPENEQGQAQNITQRNPEVTDEDEIRGIKKGRLFPYITNPQVYRCPANTFKSLYDSSRVYVSYSIPMCLNGYPGANSSKQIKKYSQIKNPSLRYNFVEAFESRNWNSGHHFWLSSPEAPGYSGSPSNGYRGYGWWGPISINHGDSSVLAYCDGHSEKRKWRDEYTIERVDRLLKGGGDTYGQDFPPPDQLDDIKFMSEGWAFRYRGK